MFVGSNPHLPDPVASKEEIAQNKSSLLLLALPSQRMGMGRLVGWLYGFSWGLERVSPTHGALVVGALLLNG